MTLSSRIKKLAKVNARNATCPINEVDSDIDYYSNMGAVQENARLIPLIDKLAECAEVLSVCQVCWDSSLDLHPVLKAREELERLVAQMEKERGE